MAYVLTSFSGNLISAASAGCAPTNSADVSAIASGYQVVSSTSTQLYAGTAFLTEVNDAPVSASRAGNAANAGMANSAYYDGTGRLISSLPDSAAVSSIASSYAESAASGKLDSSASSSFYSVDNPSGFITGVDLSDYATTGYVDSSVSGKQDALEFAYDADSAISSINGSALAGQGGGASITAVSYDTATQQSSIVTATGFGIVGSATNYPRVSSVKLTDGQTRHIEANTLAPGAAQTSIAYTLQFSPASSMWTTAGAATGIYSPLQYGTGAGLFMDNGNFKGYLKGNELFVCNTGIGRAARLEVHQSRGSRLGLTGHTGSYTVNLTESELTIVNSSLSTATLGRTKLEFKSPDSGTATFSHNYIKLYDTAESAAKTISSTSIDYWNGKLDSSAIECDTASAITAIGGSAIAGGGGGVDSATVSAIASAYVESGVSSKLDTTAFNSGDFYTTANESGYVGSAYVDSAVSGKMDSSAMTSYALSADVSGTVDLVSTQSANWGGSALALSAGPGVKLEKVGDTLVAGLDETVLWSGTVSTDACSTFTLSEYASHFDRLRFYGSGYANTPVMYECPAPINSTMPLSVTYVYYCASSDGSPSQCRQSNYTSTNGLVFNASTHRFAYGNDARYSAGNTTQGAPIYKIVGINRTAEA